MGESISAVYVKAGGSFITFKDKPNKLNPSGISSLVKIMKNVKSSSFKIVLGNGGGSFAHPVVEMFKDKDPVDLLVHCQRATRLLNHIVVSQLVDAGIRASSIQTSTIIYEGPEGLKAYPDPVINALSLGVIPCVYGECVFSKNGIYRVLSTETVFHLLSRYIKPVRLVLLVNVDGVYTCNPEKCDGAELIPSITPSNFDEVVRLLSGSAGIDVTGGIKHKVESMYAFSREWRVPVYIVSGFRVEDAVKAILGEEGVHGTVIRGY